MADQSNQGTLDGENLRQNGSELPPGWLSHWPWVTFLLPMIVFMVLGSFEPKPPETSVEESSTGESSDLEEQYSEEWEDSSSILPISYKHYPYVYSIRILLVLLCMALVWAGYRTFPWKVSGWSFLVGTVGVVLWIALCHLDLEVKVLGPIDRFLGSLIPGLEEGDTPSVGLMTILGTGTRSAFNPLEQLKATPIWAYTFLAIRFIGLALVVPVIEEFFLRGFLMRYVMHEHWWKVPFGTASRSAIVVGTIVPMMMHPGELLAALVWFSMVTWLMLKTRNIWDCVVAHGVTNLLLGVYVVLSGEWHLM